MGSGPADTMMASHGLLGNSLSLGSGVLHGMPCGSADLHLCVAVFARTLSLGGFLLHRISSRPNLLSLPR